MKNKTTNIEIFNYLNITNQKLGTGYKLTGFNPLPDDFSFDTKTIKERLLLSQMAQNISFPEFLFEEKKNLKKRFSLSVKRIEQILKEKRYAGKLSKEFEKKFETYLVLRHELSKIIISEFKKTDFNECEAYTEICTLDTIFFDLLDGIFEPEFNFLNILDNLEDEYAIYYAEKLKKIEQKNNEKIKKIASENEIVEEINKKIIKNKKNEEKKEKNTQKMLKNKQIAKIKQNKIERKNKEK